MYHRSVAMLLIWHECVTDHRILSAGALFPHISWRAVFTRRFHKTVHFFPQKVNSWRPFFLFLVVASKRRSKTTNSAPNLPDTAKNVLKLTPAPPGGALGVQRSALTNFPCKLRLNFFPPSWRVQVHPLDPRWLRLCDRRIYDLTWFIPRPRERIGPQTDIWCSEIYSECG